MGAVRTLLVSSALFALVALCTVYVIAHYQCILATPWNGFEFECAEKRTIETLRWYAETLRHGP